MFARLTVELL